MGFLSTSLGIGATKLSLLAENYPYMNTTLIYLRVMKISNRIRVRRGLRKSRPRSSIMSLVLTDIRIGAMSPEVVGSGGGGRTTFFEDSCGSVGRTAAEAYPLVGTLTSSGGLCNAVPVVVHISRRAFACSALEFRCQGLYPLLRRPICQTRKGNIYVRALAH
jgi:hypothetical protein